MRIIFTTLLMVLLSSTTLFAQNTILWKVTGKSHDKVSYLLGTYHLFGNSFVDSFPVLTEKIKTADVIITETKLDRPKLIALYNSRPSSAELSKALPGEDVALIADIFKKGKIDINKFTPGELFVKLRGFYPKYKCNVINRDDTLSMDEYIQLLGAAQKKEPYYFETDSLQLEKITEATKAYDWAFFKRNAPAVLKQYRDNNADESQCSLAFQYASLNIDYKFQADCNDKSNGVINNSSLVKNRNDEWIKQLPALIDNRNCFIAVGLGHLYYTCGLIAQLKNLGYQVEPVKLN